MNKPGVVSIINLQNVLPQIVKPSTRFFKRSEQTIEPFLRLLHIEIARFTTNLIVFVTVALIIGLPRVAVSHYVVPHSPDFPLNINIQLCSFVPIGL